jgi:hypothetical protein
LPDPVYGIFHLMQGELDSKSLDDQTSGATCRQKGPNQVFSRTARTWLRSIEIRVYTYLVSSMSPLIWIVPAIMSGLFFVYSRHGGTRTSP